MPKAPSAITIAGGIRLEGMKFRVVGWDPDGRPTTFELLPPGAVPAPDDRTYTLWACEAHVRAPGQRPPEQPEAKRPIGSTNE